MTKPSWMNTEATETKTTETTPQEATPQEAKKTVHTLKLDYIDEVPGMRVIIKGRLKKGDSQNVMIALPSELNARLESEVSGAKATAIIALVMLGLKHLEEEGSTLQVSTYEMTPTTYTPTNPDDDALPF